MNQVYNNDKSEYEKVLDTCLTLLKNVNHDEDLFRQFTAFIESKDRKLNTSVEKK